MEQFKASEEDWKEVKKIAKNPMRLLGPRSVKQPFDLICRTIRELRDRVAALEATARAEQQATVKQSLTVEPEPADPDTPQSLHDVALAHVDTLGRSFFLPWSILETLRRAIREPMAAPAEPGKVATDEEIQAAYDEAYIDAGGYQAGTAAGFRAIYNLSRQHGAACPYIRSSDEGTSYCALAEQPAPAAPAPDPALPAPAGGLVEEIRNRLGQRYGDSYAREAIKTTAAWLLQHCKSPDGLPSRWLIDSIAQILREEATR